MNVDYTKDFLKNYKKRVFPNRSLREKFSKRLKLFIANRQDPIIKDHALTGEKQEYRAFWITGSIRVVYRIFDDTARFYDIGTHNQVY